MKQVEERYISLLTDFGFKRIFGSAPNKDLLICFLNSLFNGRQVVKDVKYLNPENVGDIYTDRKAIFDVYCEGENGGTSPHISASPVCVPAQSPGMIEIEPVDIGHQL